MPNEVKLPEKLQSDASFIEIIGGAHICKIVTSGKLAGLDSALAAEIVERYNSHAALTARVKELEAK